MQKLSHNDHIDLYRHLSFCAVGGFFGCYAVLIHSGVMGNAQTVNLIELLLDALRGDLHAVLLHLGALVLYVLGTMLTVLLPHWWGWDMHYVSPVITAAAAVMIGDSRRTFTLHQKGSSTVSMVAAAYSKNAPRCSSTLKPRPYRASMTSSSRFTVWALPMTPPRLIMA